MRTLCATLLAALFLTSACGDDTQDTPMWTPTGGSSGTAGAGTGGAGGGSGSSGTGGGTSGSGGTTSSGGTGGVAGASGTGGTGPPRDTLYVEGRHVHDRCGDRIVLQGVNHPTLYVDRAGDAMPEIAKTGANVVRIFWFATHGIAIDEAEGVITAASQNGMVPMLEMHDATGPSNWGNMQGIVDYWTSSEAVALIARHEESMLVNIANEAGPSRGQDYDEFESVYTDAITSLRTAGIRVPLVVDASGWGRDYQVLLDRGPALLQADPDHNLIFSAHLYDPLSRSEIANVLQQAVDLELPFIVGEFANRSPANGCGPDIDYLGIIAEANSRNIGWLPWSWGDNDPSGWWNGDCWEFDMTRTFSFDTLERWGEEVAVTDSNSLLNTTQRPPSLVNGVCP